MLKRSHDTPRLILNSVGAYTTDTVYRIRALRSTAEGLVYGFFNSLTPSARKWKDGTTAAAFWNWCLPREREREREKLLLPVPEGIVPDVERLDRMIRENTVADTPEVQSEAVLGRLPRPNRWTCWRRGPPCATGGTGFPLSQFPA